jgi:hypothetical protein
MPKTIDFSSLHKLAIPVKIVVAYLSGDELECRS